MLVLKREKQGRVIIGADNPYFPTFVFTVISFGEDQETEEKWVEVRISLGHCMLFCLFAEQDEVSRVVLDLSVTQKLYHDDSIYFANCLSVTAVVIGGNWAKFGFVAPSRSLVAPSEISIDREEIYMEKWDLR